MNIVDGFRVVAGLAGLMLALQVINALSGYSLNGFGLLPQSPAGLAGIVVAPFLHGSFVHLAGNLLPFLVLGTLVAAEGARRFVAASLVVVLLGGLLVWLFGREGLHIGASGWVFGLWTWLLARAWYRRSARNLLAAGLALFLYGGLVFGLLPWRGTSFESHIAGALAGLVAARLLPPAGRGARA
ncbi:rhomboid family intramembrane serine protease [Azotobacter salinestris]|uniref:rhomboid family intramembrane serine protease n=1 Tax=Azotobacter salinestris TaxID=69964 RepID=UPI0032DECD35